MKKRFLKCALIMLVIVVSLPPLGLAEAGGIEFTEAGDFSLPDLDTAQITLGQPLLWGEPSIDAPAALEEGLDPAQYANPDQGEAAKASVETNATVPKNLTLGVKETYRLSASKATFKTTDKAVATVSKKGVITAVKKGSATIKVLSGKKVIAKCKVKVLAAPKKVTLSKTGISLQKGDTYTLKAKLPKRTASNKITWKTNDKAVAKVDANGVVTGVGVGTAKITVTTFNKKKAICMVTVEEAGPTSPTARLELAPYQRKTIEALNAALDDKLVEQDGEYRNSCLVVYPIDKDFTDVGITLVISIVAEGPYQLFGIYPGMKCSEAENVLAAAGWERWTKDEVGMEYEHSDECLLQVFYNGDYITEVCVTV